MLHTDGVTIFPSRSKDRRGSTSDKWQDIAISHSFHQTQVSLCSSVNKQFGAL